MSCKDGGSNDGSDGLESRGESRPFDISATAWLLGQGVRYLNTVDKDGELSYQRVVELLRRCNTDLIDTLIALFRKNSAGDAMLRWNLLHVLGDSGDQSAVDFLLHTTLSPLPEAVKDACESARDIEMLVNTMAVHALSRIAQRHAEARDALLKVVSARPARPLLIEALKCADEHGLKDKARELLPKEDHWMLDIRRARAQELYAEPERDDGKERGFTPPKSGEHYTAPKFGCCQH